MSFLAHPRGKLPGFCDHANDFHDAHVVDKDNWTSGFVTTPTPLTEHLEAALL